MDIKTIKQLAAIVNDAGLTCLEVTQGDLTVKLAKDLPAVQIASAAPAAIAQESAPAQESRKEAAAKSDPGLDFNEIHTVTSPMVGVFYQAAAPGETPYVQVGSKVKKGDVLCIVEAMKLMNEINALKDGEIVDICVSDGDVVEYGQTLFKIF